MEELLQNIDIKYFGIDKTILRNIKLMSINLKLLKLKKQENILNRIDQTGITTYVWDSEKEENVEISFIKIVDNKRFTNFTFGLILCDNKTKIEPYVKIETSVSYYEQDGELRGNNSKPLSMKEYRELVEQIKDYLQEEYEIVIDTSEAKWESVEITRQFTINEKYYNYSLILENFYFLAPARMWGMEEDKRKKAHGLTHSRDKDFGTYVDTMRLGNASVGEIFYDKTKQLKEKKNVELEVEFMRVEVKIKNSNQYDKTFGNKTIHEITDEDLKEYFKNRLIKDVIKNYDEFLYGVNEEGRKKKISLEKKLERRAKNKKYKNDKGKYKSGWATLFYSDVHSIEDKDTGRVIGQDSEMILAVIKKITKSNYSRTLKSLQESIDERPKTKNNLVRYNEIKTKILDLD